MTQNQPSTLQSAMEQQWQTIVTMPPAPCVVLWDGTTSIMVHDTLPERSSFPGLADQPIVRATTIARLRAIADMLEEMDRG